MSKKFSVGQTVRLINPVTVLHLSKYANQDLTVSVVGTNSISFAEDSEFPNFSGGAWNADRFEAVPEVAKVNAPAPNNTPAPAVARAKDGKFASRKVAPVKIRNGSLYNVARKSKGQRVLQVARVRTVLRDGTCVCSRHGKKFFANRKNISLAPQSDVDAYLAEAKHE